MKKVEMNQDYCMEINQDSNTRIDNVTSKITQENKADSTEINIELKGDVVTNNINDGSEEIRISISVPELSA